jgi:hypothetical protein
MQVWLLILTFAGPEPLSKGEFEGGQYQERAWCVRAAQYQMRHARRSLGEGGWRCELRTF